jgi:hypothetical protein
MPRSEDKDAGRARSEPANRSPPRRCVELLTQRFPHVRDISLQLLTHHETFRELCEEYEACSEAAERLAHSDADDARRKEYSALRLRLEGELLSYITEQTGHRPR